MEPYAEPPARTYSVDQFTLVTELGDTATVAGATVSPEFFTASCVRPLLDALRVEIAALHGELRAIRSSLGGAQQRE